MEPNLDYQHWQVNMHRSVSLRYNSNYEYRFECDFPFQSSLQEKLVLPLKMRLAQNQRFSMHYGYLHLYLQSKML